MVNNDTSIINNDTRNEKQYCKKWLTMMQAMINNDTSND